MIFDPKFLSFHGWKQSWAWDATSFFFSKSFVFLTLNNNLPPPFLSHTYLNLGPAVNADGAALLIKSASYKPKLRSREITGIASWFVSTHQGVTIVSLLRCRFLRWILVVLQPQTTLDPLPGKGRLRRTHSLLDLPLQETHRQDELCLPLNLTWTLQSPIAMANVDCVHVVCTGLHSL